VRSVVRIALATPAGSAGGRRVAAADEDAFTLAASAVERVLPDPEHLDGPVRIHLLGEFPPVAEWGFAALLGRSVEIEQDSDHATALARALKSAEEGEGGSALVVAAEMPERTDDPDVPGRSPLGAAGVAFLLEPSAEASPLHLAKGIAGRSTAAAALQLAARDDGTERTGGVTFVGDWNARPDAGQALDLEATRRAADRATTAVSEGAYVPRARYLENLPSRWRFAADRCDACGQVTFPARGNCRRCGRRDALSTVQLPRDGARVLAVTTIRKGGQPTEFDAQVEASGPYEVALVDLAGGARVTLQVTDAAPGTLRVGGSVDTRLRRLYPMEGEWRYGRKAVPSLSEPG
jgi:uncharacterized OB-fold protein